MSTLRRFGWAVLVFLVAWLALELLAYLLVAIPLEPTTWIGQVLKPITFVLAALVALLWAFNPRLLK